MSDARFNSVHLSATRREQFRAARQALFEACGPQTMAGDRCALAPALAAAPQTAIQNLDREPKAASKFFLMDKEYVYPLKVGMNTVGRLHDNDVVIADPYVSRRHCAILVHAHDGCEIHDIASKNGTLINGKPLQGPTRLRPGDHILMCDRQLVFLCRDEIPAAPEPDWQTVQIDPAAQ